jgi:hypothetical protein
MRSSLMVVSDGALKRGGNPRSRLVSGLSWTLGVVVWLALLSYGLRERFVYAATAGVSELAPKVFPVGSQLPRAAGRSTLFMFVHPECPCTRASLHELSGLLAQQSAKVSPVLVVATAWSTEPWESTALGSIARSIRGLSVFADQHGAEAARFGAGTSGHVVLYDARGRLQFSGGITASRGHVGENVGLQTVSQLIEKSAPVAQQHAVYGCPLEDE